MNIPFASKLRSGKNTLVVDVGSGSIGMAVAERRSGKPSIIHLSRRAALPHAERSEEQLVSALVEQTQQIGEKFFKEYAERQNEIGPIASAAVIFHAPWVSSRTMHASAPLKEPMKVMPEMIEQLTERALAQEEKKLASGEVFEQSVVRVELNGYPTMQPEGKLASTVGVVVLESSVNQKLADGVRTAVERFVPSREIAIYSATLVDASLLRAYASRVADFTIADVTSEATAFTAVRFGRIAATQSVPVGVRTVLRRVAKQRGSAEEDVESRVRMLMQDMCSDDECRELLTSLNNVAGQCTTEFGEAFEEMSQTEHLPNTLILRAHPAFVKWFSDFFGRVDFAQFTQTTRPFLVSALTPSKLADFSIFAAGESPDTALAVAGAFVHREE